MDDRSKRKGTKSSEKFEKSAILHADKHHLYCTTSRNTRLARRRGGPTTHIVFGILVGAGIQQQTHAVRAATASGINQRRVSGLRMSVQCANATSKSHDRGQNRFKQA